MYNRESFNRGKFNVSSGNQQVSGRVLILLDALDANGSLIITAPPGKASITFAARGQQTADIYAAAEVSEIALDVSGENVRELYTTNTRADVYLNLCSPFKRADCYFHHRSGIACYVRQIAAR